MKSCKKRLMTTALIGFAYGVVLVNIFTLLINYLAQGEWLLCMPELTNSMGRYKAAILQTVLGGLFGMVSYGGSCVFEIEKWSLLRATVVHYLMILITYLLIGRVLYWYSFEVISILVLSVILFLAYAAIWCTMYLSWKRKVCGMNKLMEEYKNKDAKEDE